MLRFCLVVLASACTTHTATSDQAIIGGRTTTHAEYPTVVALQDAREWGCTGILIDKDWVLSAAHCVEGETVGSLKIRFDDANLNDSSGGKLVAVSAIHAKPDWVDPIWDNDIALIRLATSITDREPTPIERRTIVPGTSVVGVGYGDADDDGNGSGILREMTATTIDCADTNDSELSGENLLCFDPTPTRASCDGDSGGPAFVRVDGTLRVAGINSGNTGDTCTTGWELYTAVAGELAFIDKYLRGDGADDDTSSDDDRSDPGEEDVADGGCEVAGGPGGLAWLLVALLRRRRRST